MFGDNIMTKNRLILFFIFFIILLKGIGFSKAHADSMFSATSVGTIIEVVVAVDGTVLGVGDNKAWLKVKYASTWQPLPKFTEVTEIFIQSYNYKLEKRFSYYHNFFRNYYNIYLTLDPGQFDGESPTGGSGSGLISECGTSCSVKCPQKGCELIPCLTKICGGRAR
jgi:hypothetical protein